MPRSRYQQQESANKRWRSAIPGKAGRRRPVAYTVEYTPPRPPDTDDIFLVGGPDTKSLKRAYKRAKRRADNTDGIVKPLYKP